MSGNLLAVIKGALSIEMVSCYFDFLFGWVLALKIKRVPNVEPGMFYNDRSYLLLFSWEPNCNFTPNDLQSLLIALKQSIKTNGDISHKNMPKV